MNYVVFRKLLNGFIFLLPGSLLAQDSIPFPETRVQLNMVNIDGIQQEPVSPVSFQTRFNTTHLFKTSIQHPDPVVQPGITPFPLTDKQRKSRTWLVAGGNVVGYGSAMIG